MNPKYHVFINGVLSMPNDLVAMKQALSRFADAVESVKGPRDMVTLVKRRGKRLRVFHADRQPRKQRRIAA
jgi:hypothetical protein